MRSRLSSILHLAVALVITVLCFQPLHAQVPANPGDLTVKGINYDESGEHPFTMIIKGREARIDQGGLSMIFRPSGPQPGLLFLDHQAKRVDFLPSDMIVAGEAIVAAETDASAVAQTGFSGWPAAPATVTVIEQGVSREVAPQQGLVGYKYEGSSTLPAMGEAGIPPEMKDMIKVVLKVDGVAAVDPTLPGASTAAAFYQEMAQSSLSSNSMTSGMMAVNAGLASNGLPVWVGSISEVYIEVGGPMAGMMQGMLANMPGLEQKKTYSVSTITTIDTSPVDPALLYDGGMPPGYEVNVIDMAEAMPKTNPTVPAP